MRKRGLKNLLISFLFVAGFLAAPLQGLATHLRAGQITVSRPNCSGLTFIITITVYTNTGSSIMFGDGLLDFGDGSTPFVTPQIANSPFDPSQAIGIVTYQHTYTYAGPGKFTISYFEHNRNAGILNMTNSVDTPFYIETVIDIDPLKGCDNSPVLTVPPIDKACTGTPFYHNPGAYDPDGDSLSYVLVPPKQDRLHDVDGYQDPNAQAFYAGGRYQNSTGTGTPTFSINAVTGTITWDAPGAAGEYNIAFHVIEWRKQNGVWSELGYVTRDMQIIVKSCTNHPPKLEIPADTCVVAGTLINKEIFGTDPDLDSVKIEAFSQVFSINPSPATVTPSPAVFEPTSATVTAKMNFKWQTECLHVKEQPYQVVFKATDRPKPNTGGVALVNFATWNITVVGPAPIWTSVVAQAPHSAKLVWQTYTCSPPATTMQIWRRVESNPYDPPTCVTGMPPTLGFTLINVVPIGTTTYVDNNGGRGLSPGAQYCYRLVAVFPQPAGGLSYVSKEQCFLALQDAPVITNVSIDKTDIPGQDTIKWVPPLKSDVNQTTSPAPYSYKLIRAEGFSGGSYAALTSGKLADTTYIDSPPNTVDNPYNYRVIAYDSNGVLVDTSAMASSVRLTLRPNESSIDLTWNATVPWSNVLKTHPLHTIYRGPAGSTQLSQMQQIATVDVTQQNFHYTDAGPLDKTVTYCYCVRTEGGYGSPHLPEPLPNFSQIACAQPSDNTPPCTVTINAKGTDCNAVYANSCTATSFSNTLTWNRPTSTCLADGGYTYNVYAAFQTGGSFALRATAVTDTFYVDNNLASFAQCYKVSAVSRSGIESALSDAFCFDNCPHYELPNVFTPGTVDGCNDKFSAYSDRIEIGEGGTSSGGSAKCPPLSETEIMLHCARFVNSVNFVVVNRWGKEVFNYESGGENSIYIDWDGRDDQGKELSAGIYYYVAKVNFQVVDPAKQNQTIKGWVQIVK